MNRKPSTIPAQAGTATPPTREFMRFIEGHAAVLRAAAKVGPLDPVNPQLLCNEFNIAITTLDDVHLLSPEDRAHLESIDPKTWSGAGLALPDGRFLVLLHPRQTKERANVTIMEEVAHGYFGHQPTRLAHQANGAMTREYDPAAEQEAYWTAAATLLPSVIVARAVWHRRPLEALVVAYGVSLELIKFRIKTLQLWSQYRANGTQTQRAG